MAMVFIPLHEVGAVMRRARGFSPRARRRPEGLEATQQSGANSG
ncbi:hypothetical protein FM101_15340 [Arthrobacter rhombi]|uniref:Uncharacterized protein n=1 Tax=Arthrobacter rhombi TaxID=71253 RepID=A0A1R4GWD9_9MICC|nr:hypothetical protein FM101_15340 [Arthrobacter rhombi]